MSEPVICEDDVHCGCHCPNLMTKQNGDIEYVGVCVLTGNDLMWHDYWIAECGNGKETTGGSAE